MAVPNAGMLVVPELPQIMKGSAKPKQSQDIVAHEPPAALTTTAAGVTGRAQQDSLTLALTWPAAHKHSRSETILCHMHQNRRMLQPHEPPTHVNNTVTDATLTASDPEQDERMAAVVSFMEKGHKLTNQILEENFRPSNKTSGEKSGGW